MEVTLSVSASTTSFSTLFAKFLESVGDLYFLHLSLVILSFARVFVIKEKVFTFDLKTSSILFAAFFLVVAL